MKTGSIVFLGFLSALGSVSAYLSYEGRGCFPNSQDPGRACDPSRFLECQQDQVCRCRRTSSGSQLSWISRIDRCGYRIGSPCSPDGSDRRSRRQINFPPPGIGGGNSAFCPKNSFCSEQTGTCTCERGYPPSYDFAECKGSWLQPLSPLLGIASFLLSSVYLKMFA